jgi:DNA-binding response OmpR family regulator
MKPLVLVVDDDNAARVGLSTLLADAGYDAIAVGTVETALQALASERPHLLLVSMELDGCTGLQLLAMNPRPIPSIMLSGFRDPVIEEEARKLGAEYVVKPVPPAALIDIVTRRLAPGDDIALRPTRRYARKPLGDGWPIQVEDSPARVLDVSYGGLRIELERAPGAWLPLSFRLVMPTASRPVDVNVVWKRRNGGTTWICGATVSEGNRESWQRVVDAIN